MIGFPTNTNPGALRADRLLIEGVERVLVDIPGCPLILTTDSPYRRHGDNNWWSFLVQVDRQDTYDEGHVEVQSNHSATRCVRIRLDNGLDHRTPPINGVDDASFTDSVMGIDRDANSDSDTRRRQSKLNLRQSSRQSMRSQSTTFSNRRPSLFRRHHHQAVNRLFNRRCAQGERLANPSYTPHQTHSRSPQSAPPSASTPPPLPSPDPHSPRWQHCRLAKC